MTEETRQPAALPVAPSATRLAAVAELQRLGELVEGLSEAAWSTPSAAEGWTIGDVVAHMNLALAAYVRVLDAALAGKTSKGMWKAFGSVSKAMAPIASPAFNAINSAIPKVMDRALSANVLKAQFEDGERGVRERLERVGDDDYTRPVYYMGGPWPLSFFLAAMTNEFAVHRWDMASRLEPDAHLDVEARAVLPWFYWSASSWMLRPPSGTTGTVQARLRDPDLSMWWTMAGTPAQGTGETPLADATITGEAGTFILLLAGRLKADTALANTSLAIEGNDPLARTFLRSWRIV